MQDSDVCRADSKVRWDRYLGIDDVNASEVVEDPCWMQKFGGGLMFREMCVEQDTGLGGSTIHQLLRKAASSWRGHVAACIIEHLRYVVRVVWCVCMPIPKGRAGEKWGYKNGMASSLKVQWNKKRGNASQAWLMSFCSPTDEHIVSNPLQ